MAASTTTAASASAAPLNELLTKTAQPWVRDFMSFVDAAVTPYHAVASVAKMLSENGFKQIAETEASTMREPNGRYFVIRNQSSIVAVAVGGKYDPKTNGGLKIAGAHTDSPVLALRPKTSKAGNSHLGVHIQPYGGLLAHTWFDRNLSCAGRLVIQKGGPDAPLVSKLVDLDHKPILRVPNLAIHLTKADEREAFKFNREQHMMPIGATEAISAALGFDKECSIAGGTSGPQSGPLFKMLAERAGCEVKDIVDFELSLYDCEKSKLFGFHDEFISTARIDNLLSCWAATRALLNSADSQASDTMTRIISLFDHEEVGSSSTSGAAGSLLPDVLDRILSADPAERAASKARSVQWSVDGAHAWHANYSERHTSVNRPVLNSTGIVIKNNSNQRYATNATTSALCKAVARRVDPPVPIEEFCVKNDSPCGSTIGPISSTLLGIKTVDLGAGQLSMHSISEMTGVCDVYWLYNLLKGYFGSTEAQLTVEESSQQ